jgi:MFS family permease
MPPPAASAFAALRHPVFRSLWIANLASNTGMWIQNTSAGWLMTSLAPSPIMVSLVQAAAMLPVFLFALPGGALADILDESIQNRGGEMIRLPLAVPGHRSRAGSRDSAGGRHP